MPYLEDALNDASPEVRRAACRNLGQIGSETERAIPGLARRVREEKDDNVRGEAAIAMIKIDPLCSQVKDCLTMALVGGDGTAVRRIHGGVIAANRIWACDQITSLGDRAAWAEDTLRELVAQVALNRDAERNADLFDKCVQALVAIRANDVATLALMKKIRDGKGIVTKNSERMIKAKIAADSCTKAVESVRR